MVPECFEIDKTKRRTFKQSPNKEMTLPRTGTNPTTFATLLNAFVHVICDSQLLQVAHVHRALDLLRIRYGLPEEAK
jgi:hypothetical protein